MAGFFSLLIGYFVFLIISYFNGKKIWDKNKYYYNNKKEYAIKHNKPVWFEGYNNQREKTFAETRSMKKVFKGIDKNGLKRWYYTDTKNPMQYVEDEKIIKSIEQNKIAALTEKRKWCLAENFWDNSINDVEDKMIIPYIYLDDYGINNRLNQRIYIKNMRPYQLYLIGTSGTEFDYYPLIKKQYLIRFGKLWFFNYKTQHCISDKQLNSKNNFWSKWYAITEEEYLELTQPILKKYNNKFNTSDSLKNLKPIDVKDIAFVEGVKEPKWELKNCGIIKAFDNEGNFVEDTINYN